MAAAMAARTAHLPRVNKSVVVPVMAAATAAANTTAVAKPRHDVLTNWKTRDARSGMPGYFFQFVSRKNLRENEVNAILESMGL